MSAVADSLYLFDAHKETSSAYMAQLTDLGMHSDTLLMQNKKEVMITPSLVRGTVLFALFFQECHCS